jgi:hypothetical protein
MKSTEMLNQIKTLLNIKVKLEEQKLENGTRVEAESFEKGKEIFILTDDEKVAMPVGEYLLEDGRLVVVKEEGLIDDVREVSDEVPQKEEESKEEAKDETEDLEEDDMMRDMMGRIQNLEDAIADLKDDKEGKMEKDGKEKEVEMEEEEVSRQPKSRTIKEEFNEEVNEQLKEELSKPAAAPIKHNPEGGNLKKENFRIAPKRRPSTMDIILNQLNK